MPHITAATPLFSRESICYSPIRAIDMLPFSAIFFHIYATLLRLAAIRHAIHASRLCRCRAATPLLCHAAADDAAFDVCRCQRPPACHTLRQIRHTLICLPRLRCRHAPPRCHTPPYADATPRRCCHYMMLMPLAEITLTYAPIALDVSPMRR